uniref:Uncharacterized protein n=1 Tax=Anguilla anguilla TaxID=7936 RepID=A0A0E9Q6K0_ANGAN
MCYLMWSVANFAVLKCLKSPSRVDCYRKSGACSSK